MAHDAATALADKLTTGTWTHDYGISAEEAKQLGLPVSTDMLQEVYDFMALFPQPTRMRPAVEYVPMPYRGARQPRGEA
jgi:ClpP class serine protease